MGAAVAAVGSVSGVLNTIEGLFTGSSYDQTHQQILAWSGTIGNDPSLQSAAAQHAWLWLRCWAGDQSVLAAYRAASGDPAPAGCGCEVSHGCRADAQAAVQTLKASYPQLSTGALSSAPQPQPTNTNGTPVLGVNTQGQITAQVPTTSLFLSNIPLLLGIAIVILVGYLAFRRK